MINGYCCKNFVDLISSIPGSNIQVSAMIQESAIQFKHRKCVYFCLLQYWNATRSQSSFILHLPLELYTLHVFSIFNISFQKERMLLLHLHMNITATPHMVPLATKSTSFYKSSSIPKCSSLSGPKYPILGENP